MWRSSSRGTAGSGTLCSRLTKTFVKICLKMLMIGQGTYGFCEFEDLRDAQDAVKDLDGKSWLGGRVRIEHARDSRYEFMIMVIHLGFVLF